ncbi:unnamed protein product, partial [Prorocentrum cordatum]
FGLEVFSAPRRQPRVPRATASLLGAMRTACSAAGVFALLSFVAAADCADYSCSADQDQETAALLQHAAAAQLKKAHASGQVNTTETTTLTCYPDRATATCGASGKCFLDTAGCSPSGGGTCCMAAGTHGPKQCRFCNCFGTDYCANFPSPTPSPPSPSPTADTADDELPPAGGQRLRGLLRVRPERVLVRLLPAWPRLREVLPWGWRIPHLPAAHRHNRRPLR